MTTETVVVGVPPVESSSEVRRPLILTNDLDGVHFVSPFPVLTAYALARNRFKLNPLGQDPGAFREPKTALERARNGLWRWTIRVRPYRGESKAALQAFKDSADRHHRVLSMAVLTGRLLDQHVQTIERLRRSGHLEWFDELHLNTGHSTSGWKEGVARKLVEGGKTVVHLEDDLKAALAMARVQDDYPFPAVLVYLVRNPSNRDFLLRRGGVTLPPNVIPVPNLLEAARRFDASLAAGGL